MKPGTEIRWVLEGFEPDTIPMTRLAEYMTELAKLFGEEEHVRFVQIEDNCVAVVSKVLASGSFSRVERGLRGVGEGNAPPAKLTAYRRINEMLDEDHGYAYAKRGSAILLRFPGVTRTAPEVLTIDGVATVTGYLYHWSEDADGWIGLRLRQQSQPYARCYAPKHVGEQLRGFLSSTVRLTGKGKWVRTANGDWSVTDLQVTDGVQLKDVSLREATDALRAIKGRWRSDPLKRQAEFDRKMKGMKLQTKKPPKKTSKKA